LPSVRYEDTLYSESWENADNEANINRTKIEFFILYFLEILYLM
jgi:hypothetical protein